MEQYRVKNAPGLIVKAAQLTADNVDDLANWAQAQIVNEGRDAPDQEALNVRTPNGRERLHQGMYLVKVGSHFYTVSEANFQLRYIAVSDAESAPPPTPTDDPWKGVPRIGQE